jgi:hypothetical protein
MNHESLAVMNYTTKQILFWSPKARGILFALFITVFSVDVFGTLFFLNRIQRAELINK